MDEIKGKFQYAGLKFLYDMELVDDPQLINNMKLNVFDCSSSIREVELLSSYHHKQMLIWLEVNWFGRIFLENRIIVAVTDRVQQLLPGFKFRVTTDRKIFDLALTRVKNVLKGENNEVPRTVDGIVGTKSSVSKGASSGSHEESDSSGDPETKPKG